uniref:Uncharacterized protein n=1 Tax=Trypanosoma congolense (strain IL3000) TaxID=1068625 RepID=G0URZ1_TRYCI|nr:conserved hypothetical protein [Trypanosoma congolense IL3000]
MPDPYIVRFKVLRIECPMLTRGQQFTITYKRGETCRSTPCYVSENNFVDFSTMPEGSAVVHFKSGGLRYLPKWITIRVEEYLRDRARKAVGETRIDCADVLGPSGKTAAAKTRVGFSLYGAPAEMTVAMLVYPEKHAPLSFNTIIPQPSDGAGDGRWQNQGGSGSPGSLVKRMAKDDVVTLLLALESLAERRCANIAHGLEKEMPLKARIAELEDRQRSFSGVEGMAQAVVQSRTVDLISAKYRALSQRHRANFTGQVAAYLRQLAVMNGVKLTEDISRYMAGEAVQEDNSSDVGNVQGRAQRMRSRIELLTNQVSKMEAEMANMFSRQDSFGTPVDPHEVQLLTAKIDSLNSQKKLLQQSCAAIEGAAGGRGVSVDHTPVIHEVVGIRARIIALSKEEEQLREKVRRMVAVAVNNVLKWARSKNPPMEDIRTGLASLSGIGNSDTTGPKEKVQGPSSVRKSRTSQPSSHGKNTQQAVDSSVTKKSSRRDSDAGNNAETTVCETAKEQEGTVPVEGPIPGWRRHQDPDMFGATGLPSVNDFEMVAAETQRRELLTSQDAVTEDAVSAQVADLGSSMFSAARRSNVVPSPIRPRGGQSAKDESALPQLNFDAVSEEKTASSRGPAFSIFENVRSAGVSQVVPTIQFVSVDEEAYTYDVGETADGNHFTGEDSTTFNSYPIEEATKYSAPAFGARDSTTYRTYPIEEATKHPDPAFGARDSTTYRTYPIEEATKHPDPAFGARDSTTYRTYPIEETTKHPDPAFGARDSTTYRTYPIEEATKHPDPAFGARDSTTYRTYPIEEATKHPDPAFGAESKGFHSYSFSGDGFGEGGVRPTQSGVPAYSFESELDSTTKKTASSSLRAMYNFGS